MTTEDFIEKGFTKLSDGTGFLFEKILISDEVIREQELIDEDGEIPTLLYGSSGLNSGFCVFVQSHFIWIDARTIDEALDFSSKITNFEPVF